MAFSRLYLVSVQIYYSIYTVSPGGKAIKKGRDHLPEINVSKWKEQAQAQGEGLYSTALKTVTQEHPSQLC